MEQENESKLPCLNCICLPICKAKVRDKSYLQTAITKHLSILHLKCSLIREYIALDDRTLDEISLKEAFSYIANGHINVTARMVRQSTSGTI